jgi:FHA domain-containing protein
MATCPKGHESSTADYCEVCGSPIVGAAATPSGSPAGEPGPASTPAGPDAGADAGAQTCPQCGTPRSGRFCEVDGYDFVAADLGGGSPAPEPEESADEPAAPPLSVVATKGWRLTVSADKEYYDRVQAMGGPDASAMTYPQFFPERQFQLVDGKMLIGRRSLSRGIEPQIDLTGPPEDPGVSHSHALLVPAADGGWSVVDLDSANGTYLNGSADPLSPNTPVPLHDGDRIHVGAWTTLTVATS